MASQQFLEQFFICTVKDIRERHTKTLYDAIRCAGMLRHLILDGGKSLVVQVNRYHKTKILYEVADSTNVFAKENPKIWVHITPTNGRESLQLEIREFLQVPICLWEGHKYTVRDMIDYFSHFLGGIHSGEPKNDKEIFFTKINRAVPFVRDWPSRALFSIIQITLKALEPLEAAIIGHTHAGGFSPQS